MKTRALSGHFGVEVSGISLEEIVRDGRFDELRNLFDEHSALLFRGQDFGADTHLKLAALFGPIEDRNADERKDGETFTIPEVSNIRPDGSISDEMDLHTLHLQSNFQWHCDSTFMPQPALVNIITAHILPSEGGNTELATTRASWEEMPDHLRAKIEGRGIWHHYSHSRKKISEELSRLPMFHKWPAQHWKPVWTNPANGKEALYIASHAYKIDGYDDAESEAILAELTAFCTQERYVYSHQWKIGDVLMWDQRAVMHRGTPWPYDQPRKLISTCSSVTERDGLAEMRVN